MAIESINREFEVFMRDMMNAQECVHENIESELRSLIRTTVNSCATMYGFSAKEALSKLDSNGNLLPQISKVPNDPILKEAVKTRVKEAEKAENDARLKEAQKAHKAEIKAFEKAEKQRRFAFESAKKCQEKAEKANERSERNQMKEQDIASKAINMKKKKMELPFSTMTPLSAEMVASLPELTTIMTPAEKHYEAIKRGVKKYQDANRDACRERCRNWAKNLKNDPERYQKYLEKKNDYMKKYRLKKTQSISNLKKNKKTSHCESLASTVIMTDSEDEEIHILFQNLPLIEEINLIRNIKVQKKLSKGVKLARQILDI
jgi:hypothetical protein